MKTMKYLEIEILEFLDRYTFRVLEQSHRGKYFAPGNFCQEGYFGATNHVKYVINGYEITLYSYNCPEINMDSKNKITVFLRGNNTDRDLDIIKCGKYEYPRFPVEEILTAVSIYNYGIDYIPRKILIGRKNYEKVSKNKS